MSTYNETLQSNNALLEEIKTKATNLPDAGSGGSGVVYNHVVGLLFYDAEFSSDMIASKQNCRCFFTMCSTNEVLTVEEICAFLDTYAMDMDNSPFSPYPPKLLVSINIDELLSGYGAMSIASYEYDTEGGFLYIYGTVVGTVHQDGSWSETSGIRLSEGGKVIW